MAWMERRGSPLAAIILMTPAPALLTATPVKAYRPMLALMTATPAKA